MDLYYRAGKRLIPWYMADRYQVPPFAEAFRRMTCALQGVELPKDPRKELRHATMLEF